MHRTGRVKRSFVPITASKPLYEGSNNRALVGFDLVFILTRIQRYLIFRYSNVHVWPFKHRVLLKLATFKIFALGLEIKFFILKSFSF